MRMDTGSPGEGKPNRHLGTSSRGMPQRSRRQDRYSLSIILRTYRSGLSRLPIRPHREYARVSISWAKSSASAGCAVGDRGVRFSERLAWVEYHREAEVWEPSAWVLVDVIEENRWS